MRKSDLTDVSKPLKVEKERKDALANIDINNYASKYFCVIIQGDRLKSNFFSIQCLMQINQEKN